MKKCKKILLFCITLFIIIIPFVKADSGFDSSYSGGGSGYSGGYSGRYSGGSGSVVEGYILAAIFIFLVVRAFIKAFTLQKGNILHNPSLPSMYNPVNYDEITKLIPNFNKDKFKNQAFEIYVNIQNAWMNFDYDTLRKYTTDEMYNMYESQLDTLKVKNQKNVMSDYNLNDFDIIGINITKNDITIKTYMNISLIDYISDKNNMVIKGYPNHPITISYEMTFIKSIDENENVCPNCHAPLPSSASAKCEYCDSIITPKSHDFVLSKKVNRKQS